MGLKRAIFRVRFRSNEDTTTVRLPESGGMSEEDSGRRENYQ